MEKSNLTIKQEIVKRVNTLKFIEGYVIAVFERQGDSRVCRSIFSRKDGKAQVQLWKKWLGLSRFESFAVTTFAQCRYNFSDIVQHHSQIHDIQLNYTLDFQVVDAEAICVHLESDPLLRFTREIHTVIDDAIAAKPWAQIVGDFANMAEKVLKDKEQVESRFEKLNRFGAELGLRMTGLKMVRKLQGKDLDIDRAKDQNKIERETFLSNHATERIIETKKQEADFEDDLREKEHLNDLRQKAIASDEQFAYREREQERQQHELEIKRQRDHQDLELEKKMKSAMIDSLGKAMENIAGNIDNGEELRDTMNSVHSIFKQFSHSSGATPHISSAHQVPPERIIETQRVNNLVPESELSQAISIIENSYCGEEIQKRLISLAQDLYVAIDDQEDEKVSILMEEFNTLIQSNRDDFDPEDLAKFDRFFTIQPHA